MIIGIGKEKRYFLENLSLLVASGMNVVEAIKNINDDVRSTAFKKVLKKVEQEVADGRRSKIPSFLTTMPSRSFASVKSPASFLTTSTLSPYKKIKILYFVQKSVQPCSIRFSLLACR